MGSCDVLFSAGDTHLSHHNSEPCLLVDGHGSDDRLDVANIVEVELEADDDGLGALAAQLVVDALLKPKQHADQKITSINIAAREKQVLTESVVRNIGDRRTHGTHDNPAGKTRGVPWCLLILTHIVPRTLASFGHAPPTKSGRSTHDWLLLCRQTGIEKDGAKDMYVQ